MTLKLVKSVLLNQHLDSRGEFTRIADTQWGIDAIQQVSISRNSHQHTLRGMHGLQREAGEYKTVTCVNGSILDVVVDLRPDSAEYMKIHYFELSPENPQTVLIPPGVVHAFITLEPNSEIIYTMTSAYDGKLEVGYRWNDPILNIDWPFPPKIISEKDSQFNLLLSKPEL